MEIEIESPSEIEAEEELLAAAEEDDIRIKVIADLGLEDNDDNGELITKLVGREVSQRAKLSKAVGQKIHYRKLAQGAEPKPKVTKEGPMDAEAVRKAAEEAAEARFEKRDLDEMEYSDSVKGKIQQIAKLNSISVRVAAKDPYVQSLIEQEDKQRQIDEAADNGSGKRKGGVKFDVSKPLDPASFDLSTEEGRTAWGEAKRAKRASQ